MKKDKMEQKVKISMAPKLRKEFEVIKERVTKYDWDYVAVIAGLPGSGKSTFARGVAKYCCSWFGLEHVAFTARDFIKLTNQCPEYSSIVLDESFQSMNSRVTMSPDFLRIINHLQLIRQKHLFIFLCLPNFFDLSKGIAVFRTSHLFVTYESGGQRGRVLAFGRDTKRKLYVRGNKYMDYDCVRANFATRYYKNAHIIPEEDYDAKKREHLMAQDQKIEKRKNPTRQRDIIIWKLKNEQGWKTKKIMEITGLARQTISDATKRAENAMKTK